MSLGGAIAKCVKGDYSNALFFVTCGCEARYCSKKDLGRPQKVCTMKIWKQLSIYTSEGSRAGFRALHTAIVATSLEQGLYSAIAVKAMEGFGPQMAIPTANHMALDSDLPIEVRITDEPEKINAFLASQRDVLADCVIVLRDVEVFWAPTAIGS